MPDWIAPVAVSPFIGSFLGVLVDRLPRGKSILVGRSACSHCGARLELHDLIPILSWLLLRGQCRRCHHAIGPLYPGIELASVGIAAWAASAMTGWLIWATSLFGWVLLALSIIDWRHFRLPDVLTLPLIPAGIAVAWLIEPSNAVDRASGAAFGFIALASLAWAYRQVRNHEGLGMGDAKLLAGIGSWVSWQGLPSVIFLAAPHRIVKQNPAKYLAFKVTYM